MENKSLQTFDVNKVLSLIHLHRACEYFSEYIPICINETFRLGEYEPLTPNNILGTLPNSTKLQEHFMASQTLISTMIDCKLQLINLLWPLAKQVLSIEFNNYSKSYPELNSYISFAIVKSIWKYNYKQTDISSFLYDSIRKEIQEYIDDLKIPMNQNAI